MLVVVLFLLQAAPPASAHCEEPMLVLGILDTCAVQGPLEQAVDALNLALQGEAAVVLVKDFRFHPEVVTIRDGGTVVWVWGDTLAAQHHDPASSASCGSREADLQRCRPSDPGRCFDVLRDQNELLTSEGDHYALSFRAGAAPGGGVLVEKSHGYLGGMQPADGLWAEPFQPCPAASASGDAGEAVLPFHCALHGGAFTPRKEMRGAVVIQGA